MGNMGHMGTASIDPSEPRRRRRTALPLLLLSAVLAVALVRTLEPGQADADDLLDTLFPTTTTTAAPRATTTTAPKPRPHVPVSTKLATPKGEITTFSAPNGKAVGKAGVWYGYRMTMPVIEERGSWLRIRLPERPNGKTAWVRRSDVNLTSTGWRVVIRLNVTKLIVYKDGFPVMVAPVGIGKASTPTAPGNFFLTVKEDPDPHGYGPFVLHTSGHSEAIKSWQGSGDAITAIHGPVSAKSDRQIGSSGTRISNGCIRMHTSDLHRLSVLPKGTPIDINPS
jgi:hypothetical protein